MKAKSSSTIFAILAATLYALSAPVGKVLLGHAGAAMMAAFLYLGAGLGLACWGRIVPDREASPITRQDLPYILGMILLDIAAPILLMLGLQRTGSANASLLNNFEIVATSLIAWLLFREKLSRRLSLAIVLVTFASIVLGYEGSESLRFGAGSALVLAAACCWGLENNCTRMLSRCSSVQITTIKGIFSGLGSLIVIWIGIGLLRSKASMEGGRDVNVPIWKVISSACVVTWFNPQAIIDGTMMLGAFRASLPVGTDAFFIGGFASASILWFLGISTVISLFSAKFNEKILNIINKICGVVIIFYGCKLLLSFVKLMGWL